MNKCARLVVLISGSGTNLQAILDACRGGSLNARVVGVVSNRKAAFGLERARAAHVPTVYLPLKPYTDGGRPREEYDKVLADRLAALRPDIVVLAGWMHVFTPSFYECFRGRVINLHPALPGQFPGWHSIQEAFEAFQHSRITHTGVMVHDAAPEVDAGEVIAQEVVPILPTDTLDDLTRRVHQTEHRLLVDAIRTVLESIPEEKPMAIRRALLSVHDKTGLVALARALSTEGVELIASGGTARAIRDAGLPCTLVESLTQFPEMLGGRVKTLHPAVHAGILARRTPEHLADLVAHGLKPIDLVVCNLYPFERTVARKGVTEAEAIEEIDIGGVTLLRAAAKNMESVTVCCDPADYAAIARSVKEHGEVAADARRALALKAFRQTSRYDAAISSYLGRRIEGVDAFPGMVALTGNLVQSLRYGENPHQKAGFYQWTGSPVILSQLSGEKEMSYNNYVDLDAAWGMVQEFEQPTVAIIKHTNPCGLASAATLEEAYRLAFAADPASAYGSVISCNVPVDLATTQAMGALFVEVLAAPEYAPEALAALQAKKNLRVLRVAPEEPFPWTLRSIHGGLLVQTPDDSRDPSSEWRVVTRRAPTAEELRSLEFAWKVAKHVKSNAIVFARGTEVVGVGAGQMSRVDSVHLAARKAGEKARGAVVGSDAFFPFADGIEAAAAAGCTAIVEPGGSLRDDEAIAAADRLGLAMLFTGVRHFRH